MTIISNFPEDFDKTRIPTIMVCLYPPIELKRNKAKKTSENMFDNYLKLIEGEELIGELSFFQRIWK